MMRRQRNRFQHLGMRQHEAGTAQGAILDATLPTGPIGRTITYLAPLTLWNRETDYAQVWAVLDEQDRRA